MSGSGERDGADERPRKLWRIGGGLYDLTEWLDEHPGGRALLELQGNNFKDATYAFESHHMNQPLVRRMLQRYYVGPAPEGSPQLCAPESFYSEFRRRVHRYLGAHGGGGPTTQGLLVWWVVVAGFFASHVAALVTTSFWCIAPLALFAGLVGGYGHNWIHQPKYRAYAYCLDFIGISSTQWLKTHVLKHHMFTNTPRDNHWGGTAPFLVVDPTKKRNWVQRFLSPLYQPVILFVGVFANWISHTKSLLTNRWIRRDEKSWAKLILPAELVLYGVLCGWRGPVILACALGLASLWYFMIALANHNTAAAWDLDARGQATDWGEAQLHASSDVGTSWSYLASALFVWLNYHTVHHLVPAVDQSHHPAIQRILIDVCDEFDVPYGTYGYWQMYKEMVTTFSTARAPGADIDWPTFWGEGR